MEIWHKYVVTTVKNHENTQKPHLFDIIPEINHKLLKFLKVELFLYMYSGNCVQDANILRTLAP